MSVARQPIQILANSKNSTSFYPSQFASFCEMGKISDLIYENRQANEHLTNDNQEKKLQKNSKNKFCKF